jgi:CBS domain-containing protein
MDDAFGSFASLGADVASKPRRCEMRVQEAMCQPVSTCSEEMSLAAAARIMGVVTDRDVCLAIGRTRRSPDETPVREVMSKNVVTCAADDDIHTALSVMSARQVRRLPVLDERGTLKGVLSMDDVVLRAEEADPSRQPPEVSCRSVVAAMRNIYGSRRLQPVAR